MITFRSRDGADDRDHERPPLRLLYPRREPETPRRETQPDPPTYRRLEEE